MICEPINDRDCLGRITARALAWSKGQAAEDYAKRVGSTAELAASIRRSPQKDDTGDGRGPSIACDQSVRLRMHPADPNCVERAAWYLAVAERLDPSTCRALGTADLQSPKGERYRHVFVVEERAGRRDAVDLLPIPPAAGRRNCDGRRNFDWSSGSDWADLGRSTVEVVHPIGAGVLTVFGLGGAANWLGGVEDEYLGTNVTGKKGAAPAETAKTTPQGKAEPMPQNLVMADKRNHKDINRDWQYRGGQWWVGVVAGNARAASDQELQNALKVMDIIPAPSTSRASSSVRRSRPAAAPQRAEKPEKTNRRRRIRR